MIRLTSFICWTINNRFKNANWIGKQIYNFRLVWRVFLNKFSLSTCTERIFDIWKKKTLKEVLPIEIWDSQTNFPFDSNHKRSNSWYGHYFSNKFTLKLDVLIKFIVFFFLRVGIWYLFLTKFIVWFDRKHDCFYHCFYTFL